LNRSIHDREQFRFLLGGGRSAFGRPIDVPDYGDPNAAELTGRLGWGFVGCGWRYVTGAKQELLTERDPEQDSKMHASVKAGAHAMNSFWKGRKEFPKMLLRQSCSSSNKLGVQGVRREEQVKKAAQ
jgi:hypothetical protein